MAGEILNRPRQNPRDTILWILTSLKGEAERRKLRIRSKMTLAELNAILTELERYGNPDHPGGFHRWPPSGEVDKVRNVHLGSCKKISEEDALQRAIAMKVVYIEKERTL
jgi:hypothetical protein